MATVYLELTSQKLPLEVKRAITQLGWHPHAGMFHKAVAAQLRALDYKVQTEVAAPYGTRRGRIDILATKGQTAIALELDHKTPRKKSIKKLTLFQGANVKAIVLREGKRHG